MTTLYQPRGKASVYAKLAVNIYRQCSAGCRYCYCPQILHITPSAFFTSNPRPRPGLVDDLLSACEEWAAVEDERPTVHLSFIGDPLPLGGDVGVTAEVISVLHHFHLPVQLLSKSGNLPPAILKLLGEDDSYGVTLTSINPASVAYWEPFAGRADARINALGEAAEVGVKTWVSLEPVISFEDAAGVLNALRGSSCSPVWIGSLNHLKPPYEWAEVKRRLADVARECEIPVRWKDEV